MAARIDRREALFALAAAVVAFPRPPKQHPTSPGCVYGAGVYGHSTYGSV
jgi:hypothetical protein